MRGDQWRDDFGGLVAECRACTDDAYPNPFNETPEEGHICEECEEKLGYDPCAVCTRPTSGDCKFCSLACMNVIGEQITQAMTYSPRIR